MSGFIVTTRTRRFWIIAPDKDAALQIVDDEMGVVTAMSVEKIKPLYVGVLLTTPTK